MTVAPAEGCGAIADRREHPRRPYERAQAHDPHGQRDVREEGMPQTAAAVPSALWRCGVRTFATAARSARVSCRGHTALTVALLTSIGACDCGCPVGWDGCGMVRSAIALVALDCYRCRCGVTKPGGSLTITPAATVGSAPFRLNVQCRKRCAARSLVQHATCRCIMRHAAYRMPCSVQQHAAKSCIRHRTARST